MIERRRFALGLASVTIASAAFGGERRFRWPSGRRAAISLTYDDGLDSQIENVAPALDRLGLRATFFLTRENMEARVADWQALARRGHEIGNHTFHHDCQLSRYSAERYEQEEILASERFLNEQFGANPHRAFAYPCGQIALGAGGELAAQLRLVAVLRKYFVAARAADGDPNDPRLVGRQRYLLQAVAPTYDRDDPELAIAYLRKALKWRRWAILIFHDVVPVRLGPGDTSIASHSAILQWILAQPLWCAPMGEVFARLTRAGD